MKDNLGRFMKKANYFIKQRRQAEPTNIYKHGILIPFAVQNKFESRYVVRVLY